MLAGDKSIIRKVFGQSKRFQPNLPSTKAQAAVALMSKRFQPNLPSTKAQAAVALMSGRMSGAINTALSRLEAESSSRLAEMEEIRSELLSRGDIQRFWHEKLEEAKTGGLKVEEVYHAALQELEEEKMVQEKTFAEHVKEKSAMDCQKQLMATLKEEVDEMSERVARETPMYTAEQHDIRSVLSNMETRLEELLDAKSVLRAEKEAIQILRSWIEDEARKSQARAEVLGEVGRRWKWNGKTGTS